MAYWAVARTEPRGERKACRHLALGGFTTYFPRLRETRHRHGRKIELRPALFPSYIFVSVEAQWHVIKWTIGVVGLLMAGDHPARVSDTIIGAIRERERNGLIELPQHQLKVGDRVKILAWPFPRPPSHL